MAPSDRFGACKRMTIINYLTYIRFEPGALAALADDLSALGIRRPLIVTDRGIVQTGLLDRLAAALPDSLRNPPVFSATPANPTEAAVGDALTMYNDHTCDGVIALGGGSPIDLAKAVALMATHDGQMERYAAVHGGTALITSAVAPVIAIPTTAGTGSEVGRAALITLNDGRKLGFVSPHLIPRRAICDPDLTTGLPPGLTAATGMDALAHCIETFLSPRINPPADAIALDGAGRVWRNIDRAVADGTDEQARWEMMMAALAGGLSFQKGLGAVHGLSHALGGLKEPSLHHGTLNAILLPPVLRLNRAAAGNKYERLASALGLDAATDLADAIETLNARLGLPPSLKGMGIAPAVVNDMAQRAMADHSTPTNPRAMTVALYEQLLRGVLA